MSGKLLVVPLAEVAQRLRHGVSQMLFETERDARSLRTIEWSLAARKDNTAQARLAYGDPSILVRLGKQSLGQSDKVEHAGGVTLLAEELQAGRDRMNAH